MKRIIILLTCFALAAHGQSVLLTKFNKQTMRFAGDPVSQAKMLVRPVLIQAHLGAELKDLPDVLKQALSGTIAPPSLAQLKSYLERNKINPADVGGDINLPLSKNSNGITANYFVIHDTSTPLYPKEFPVDIDKPDWAYNTFHLSGDVKAHVFVNRAGASATQAGFDVPWRATKFENQGAGYIGPWEFYSYRTDTTPPHRPEV